MWATVAEQCYASYGDEMNEATMTLGARQSLTSRVRRGAFSLFGSLLAAVTIALTASAASAQPSAPGQQPGAAAAAPAAKTPATEAAERASRGQASELIRKIEAAKPGPERYKLVDGVIELGDPAWSVVRAALPRLGALAEGEAVVVDLALGFMPTSYESVIALAPTLSDEAARRVVSFAQRLPNDERLTLLLQSMLPRNDERILLAIVPPLVAIADKAVFVRLIALVDETRPQLAALAVDILAANRHAAGLPALVRLLGIEVRRATTGNVATRHKLINAIARIGGEASVPPLMEALSLTDQRQAVKDGLKLVGTPAVKAALFLLRTASGSRLVIALDLLAHLRTEAAPELVTLLRSPDTATRELAIDVLTYVAVADVRPEILQVVRENGSLGVEGLLRLCVSLYNDEVRKVLFALLESQEAVVRLAAIDALWRIRDPKTYRVLRLIAAQDRDNGVRLAAVRAVAGMADDAGIALLHKMTVVPDHALKMTLVEEIARVDTWSSAVPALIPLLGDPDDDVFRATLAALERLTGKSGMQRGAQWTAWLAGSLKKAKQDFETVVPSELRFLAADREMSVMLHGDADDGTVVFVSGPPMRDATHLVPWAWQLAGDHRVAVMRRGPWPHYAARAASQRQWSAELDALLARIGRPRVTLIADAGGAAYATRYASGHVKEVAAVILLGGPWPTAAALEALPAEVMAAVPENARPDVAFGLGAGWRYSPETARNCAMRGLLGGLLGQRDLILELHYDNLAEDAFTPMLYERLREEMADFDPALTPQPILLVLGDRSPWAKSTQEALALRSKTGKSRVKLAIIAEAGAFPLAERPAATLKAIAAFLDP
jgi:pimeloyl-ACP methyl ester carboxylesterase/HEAT repeat protein